MPVKKPKQTLPKLPNIVTGTLPVSSSTGNNITWGSPPSTFMGLTGSITSITSNKIKVNSLYGKLSGRGNVNQNTPSFFEDDIRSDKKFKLCGYVKMVKELKDYCNILWPVYEVCEDDIYEVYKFDDNITSNKTLWMTVLKPTEEKEQHQLYPVVYSSHKVLKINMPLTKLMFECYRVPLEEVLLHISKDNDE